MLVSSLLRMIVLISLSMIKSTWSFSRTVSLSISTSLRSIETTSPVDSSTKSSTQVLRTLAASFLPIAALIPVLVTFISSARLKISNMSLSLSKPMALSKVVTGNFFFLSMYAYITLFMSVANSIQEPLNGITLAE